MQDFEVCTVTEMGWSGLKNGNLMRVAIDAQFDILLTIDKNLEYQQNMNKYPIIVVVFDVEKSKIDFLKLLIPQFKAQINDFKNGSVYRII